MMGETKHILVAVDFSSVSANALRYAAGLASQLGADLEVVHVVPRAEIELPENASAAHEDELIRENLAQRKTQLAEFARQTVADTKTANESVRLGKPSDEVNNLVKEHKADMIVIGTHGRTGLKHLLMGSVAESILREAEVPVLCIRSTD